MSRNPAARLRYDVLDRPRPSGRGAPAGPAGGAATLALAPTAPSSAGLAVLVLAAALTFLAALSGGCAPQEPSRPPEVRMAASPPPAPEPDKPWNERLRPATQNLTSYAALAPGIDDCLRHVSRKPAAAVALDQQGLTLTYGQMARTLGLLRASLADLDRDPALFNRLFSWVKIEPAALFTGYYEPLIPASPVRAPGYEAPIYANPGKNRKHTREAIDYKGALSGRGLEIAWAKNPLDVFFLHVQGSGRLVYPDGSTRNVLYDGSNGHRYVGLGRVLVEEGHIAEEEKSMQRIRSFFTEHPEKMRQLMPRNPSYIFFKLADDGPNGAMGTKLTPWVSCAVDPSFFPYGTLLAADARLPLPGGGTERFTGLLLAQDTGAMRGSHVDLFCGSGQKAEFQSGYMKDTATLYVLMAREGAGKP